MVHLILSVVVTAQVWLGFQRKTEGCQRESNLAQGSRATGNGLESTFLNFYIFYIIYYKCVKNVCI